MLKDVTVSSAPHISTKHLRWLRELRSFAEDVASRLTNRGHELFERVSKNGVAISNVNFDTKTDPPSLVVVLEDGSKWRCYADFEAHMVEEDSG